MAINLKRGYSLYEKEVVRFKEHRSAYTFIQKTRNTVDSNPNKIKLYSLHPLLFSHELYKFKSSQQCLSFCNLCEVSLSLTMLTTQCTYSYSVKETMEHDVMGYEDR